MYLIGSKKIKDFEVKDILKNFDIGFKYKKIKCLSKQYELDEVRFMDRDEYKIKDGNLYIMIDKIRCESDTFHF